MDGSRDFSFSPFPAEDRKLPALLAIPLVLSLSGCAAAVSDTGRCPPQRDAHEEPVGDRAQESLQIDQPSGLSSELARLWAEGGSHRNDAHRRLLALARNAATSSKDDIRQFLQVLTAIPRDGPISLPPLKVDFCLPGVRLAKVITLDPWDLSDAILPGADLSGGIWIGSNFANANLCGAKLTGVSAQKSTFKGSSLRGADLGGANLVRADFTGADLRGANMRGALLIGARFEGASLAGADLCRANLAMTTGLELTQLRHAIVSSSTLPPPNSASWWERVEKVPDPEGEEGAEFDPGTWFM